MAVTSESYNLLEGTTAVVDVQFGVAATDATPTHSAKCYANRASYSIERDTFSMDTFCMTSGWDVPRPRKKVGTITLGGFMSTGGVLSDPLALITVDDPVVFVFSVTPPGTGTTAATMTGKCLQTRESGSMQAQDTSGRDQMFRTVGPITSVGFHS